MSNRTLELILLPVGALMVVATFITAGILEDVRPILIAVLALSWIPIWWFIVKAVSWAMS